MTKKLLSGNKIVLASNSSWLKDAGYNKDEEDFVYNFILKDVYENPRWYLDNLQYIPEFRVSWGNYRDSKPITPREHIRKPKGL